MSKPVKLYLSETEYCVLTDHLTECADMYEQKADYLQTCISVSKDSLSTDAMKFLVEYADALYYKASACWGLIEEITARKNEGPESCLFYEGIDAFDCGAVRYRQGYKRNDQHADSGQNDPAAKCTDKSSGAFMNNDDPLCPSQEVHDE